MRTCAAPSFTPKRALKLKVGFEISISLSLSFPGLELWSAFPFRGGLLIGLRRIGLSAPAPVRPVDNMTAPTPIIVLPGANGKVYLSTFSADAEEQEKFSAIRYPGWQSYIAKGLSAEALIGDIVSQIVALAPQGPIRIVGISIGGHFGYAAALRLQASGREIAGFCAIDTFMIASSAPRVGWARRALELGVKLVYERRVGDFGVFIRSNFWRALLRLAGNRLLNLLRIFGSSGRLPFAFARPSSRRRAEYATVASGICALDRVTLMLGRLRCWHRRYFGLRRAQMMIQHGAFDARVSRSLKLREPTRRFSIQRILLSWRNLFFNRTHLWFSATERGE